MPLKIYLNLILFLKMKKNKKNKKEEKEEKKEEYNKNSGDKKENNI